MANLNINTTDNQINITPTDTQVRIYTGGFATPGGSNTEVQYNDNGRLAGAANITYTNGNMVISNNNFKITGGDNGYFLQTDGAGNLTWYPGTAFPTGNGTVGGANTQIQFNNSGNFGGVAGFTMNPITTNVNMPNNLSVVGNVSANYFIGNGSQLTGISVDSTQIVNGNSNVKVTANGNVTVSVAGNANVLTVTGSDVSATGNISASYFIGNGINLSGLTGANVIGVVANATYAVSAGSTNTANTAITAGTVTTNAQPNITSVGTLTSLSVSGNITASAFNGSGAGLTNLPSANISGQVANALVAGTVYTAAQPNITSVGTLTTLSVSGNANTGNIGANNGVFTSISGNGVAISALNASNLTTGTVANARLSGTYGISITGSAATLTANAQPNITSVGTLANLIVQGNSQLLGGGVIGSTNSNTTYRGNLFIEGTIIQNFGYSSSIDKLGVREFDVQYNNVYNQFQVLDNFQLRAFFGNEGPAYFAGFYSNLAIGGTLTIANTPKSTANLTITPTGNINGRNISLTANVTANNITANSFIGNGAGLTNISTVTSQTVSNNAQPNITSVGTLVSLSVTGNIIGGNFQGNGSRLSSLTGANITGIVPSANNATTSGTVTTNAQPNITSLGNLTGLVLNSANIRLGSNAGITNQGNNSIAIGNSAARLNTNPNIIAIGNNSANATTTGTANSISIGTNASSIERGSNSISIGTNSQAVSDNTIVIGVNAGNFVGANSIVIGPNAGNTAPQTNIQGNCVVLDAGQGGISIGANSFAVKPIRNITGATAGFYRLLYNPTTGEIGYSTT